MYLINYSDKSFVIFGDDTRNHKDLIKSLGGSWNSGLTHPITNERFGGWIFSNKKLNVVYEILGNYIIDETEDLYIYQPSAPELPRVVVKPVNMYIIYNIVFLCFVFMFCYIIG